MAGEVDRPQRAASDGPEDDERLRLVGLTKRFGDVLAVDSVDLAVEQGQFVALLGPSGCGKTTTLRMIGGLELPTAGRIYIGAEDITERKPHQRPVNTVFQSYALFPHLNIFENVAFGLRRTGVRNDEVRRRVGEMLELVELPGYGKHRVTELSGGMQQRVALARALVNHPKMLLLDEPLGALDLKLRRQMQLELKRIQDEVGITFVHVTHDQEEAMTMADTIAVMNRGHIEQLGTPVSLYEKPATTFVANFLGQSNLLHGTVQGRDGDHVIVLVGDAKLRIPADDAPSEGSVQLGVRPEKVRLRAASEHAADGRNTLEGVVTDRSFIGVMTQYLVRTAAGEELGVSLPNDGQAMAAAPGQRVQLEWDPQHTFVVAETA